MRFETLIKAVWIAEKDLRQFFQFRQRFLTTLILPVLMLLVFSFRFQGLPLREAPVAVFSQGNSEIQLEVIEHLDESPALRITPMSNISQAQNMLSAGNLYGVVMISSDGVDCTITVVLDDSNPVLAQSVYGVVEQAVKDVNEKISRTPIRMKTNFLYGSGFNYVNFLVPGVLATTAMFGSAFQMLTLVWEKSLGTLERILVTPVRPRSIILGKTLAGCLTGFAQTILILLLGHLIFAAPLGSIHLVLFVIFLTSFTFTGLGVLVSGICGDPREATAYNQMINWPMVFLGGVFFPIEMMPAPLQYISRLLPLTYATDALRSIMIKQASFATNVIMDIVVLTLYAVTTLALGSKILLRVLAR